MFATPLHQVCFQHCSEVRGESLVLILNAEVRLYRKAGQRIVLAFRNVTVAHQFLQDVVAFVQGKIRMPDWVKNLRVLKHPNKHRTLLSVKIPDSFPEVGFCRDLYPKSCLTK